LSAADPHMALGDSEFVFAWQQMDNDQRREIEGGFERYRKLAGPIGRGLQTGKQHDDLPTVHYSPSADSTIGTWPEPQQLNAKIDVEPYPVDALPTTIRAAVAEVAGFVQAPIALVVSSAVAALSAAAQGHVDVRRAERLQGPSGLFILAVADSGERKSTCDSFFTGTIREYEKQQAEAAVPVVRRYTSAMAAWTAEREGVLQAIKQNAKTGKPVDRLRVDLAELEQHKPEAPRIPRLIYGDATPEALTYSLATRWPSGAVISAEAGSIFGSHGMSGDSLMRNLSILNELWDGKPQTFDRRSTESYTVRGARLTVCLAIQAATLREFFGKSGALARGSGFMARFLICAPQSTQGTRHFSEAPKSWPALAAFNRRIAEILNQPVALAADGALTPVVLELSPGAKAAWIAFHDAIESELSQGGELHDVRDVASKAADNAARLAGLFHVFDSGDGAISLEAFAGAARIVAWHLAESRRFFGELAVPAEIANAHRLDDWLINHCRIARVGTVPTKVVQHRGPGPLRDRAALQAALAELEELGRARVVMAGRRRLIEVNPELLPAGGDDGTR
jgi:putative DNA primase/helicase